MVSIFVFAYYSYKDPVFQSAVLPYLKIAGSPRLRFILLTWEQRRFGMSRQEKDEIKKDLLTSNIIWYDTSWHSGKFKLLKKMFDFAKGMVLSLFLLRKYGVGKIYSEGFPGAVIGHYLSKFTGSRHIIHTFEPHADYMLEAGVWKSGDWEYKLLKSLEAPIAKRAECIVTGTEAYRDVLSRRTKKDRILVIPSCVDTAHYKFDPESRDEIRQALGIKKDQIVIVYLGKLGGMYMNDEIFEFFRYCLKLKSEKFFFFLFTGEDPAGIQNFLDKFNIPLNTIIVKYLDRKDVPAYLSAADIGFCGIRPLPSRRYSSPIKNGEYWACGLPVLVPYGMSDDYLVAQEYGIGVPFRTPGDIDLSTLELLKSKDRTYIQTQGNSVRSLAYHKEAIGRFFGTV